MPTARATLAIMRLKTVSLRLRMLASSRTTTRLTAQAEAVVNRQKVMQQIVEQRFARQSTRAVGGRRWAALKASTIASRTRMGYGVGPILQRTVALKESAKAAVANTYRIAHSRIKWSVGRVRVSYGKYHQRGGGRMPARPFLFQPDNSELMIADRIAARELRRLIRVSLRVKIP